MITIIDYLIVSKKYFNPFSIKVDKVNEADKVNITYVKNKCGKPFGEGVLNIEWGIGFDLYGELVDLSVETGIIKKAGAWFSYQGNNIGQGREAVKQLFRDNNEFYLEIKDLVTKKYLKESLETEIPENLVKEELINQIANEIE